MYLRCVASSIFCSTYDTNIIWKSDHLKNWHWNFKNQKWILKSGKYGGSLKPYVQTFDFLWAFSPASSESTNPKKKVMIPMSKSSLSILFSSFLSVRWSKTRHYPPNLTILYSEKSCNRFQPDGKLEGQSLFSVM